MVVYFTFLTSNSNITVNNFLPKYLNSLHSSHYFYAIDPSGNGIRIIGFGL